MWIKTQVTFSLSPHKSADMTVSETTTVLLEDDVIGDFIIFP